jgi:hypothetical protein
VQTGRLSFSITIKEKEKQVRTKREEIISRDVMMYGHAKNTARKWIVVYRVKKDPEIAATMSWGHFWSSSIKQSKDQEYNKADTPARFVIL